MKKKGREEESSGGTGRFGEIPCPVAPNLLADKEVRDA